MKKSLLLMVLFVFQLIQGLESNAQDISIDFPEENDIMHCRCKKGGCYAGNWVSFRPECATGHGTVDCSEGAGNCESTDDENNETEMP